MLIRKAYRYRLYPTRSQDDKLDRVLSRCRDLYNAALYQRREAYRVSKIGVSYCMQQNELPALKKEHPQFTESAPRSCKMCCDVSIGCMRRSSDA